MVHVHGVGAQQLSARTAEVPLEQLVAVAVDVGKSAAAAMACDWRGRCWWRRSLSRSICVGR